MGLPSEGNSPLRQVKSTSCLESLVNSDAKLSDDSSSSSKSFRTNAPQVAHDEDNIPPGGNLSPGGASRRRSSSSCLTQEDSFQTETGVLLERSRMEEFEDALEESPGKIHVKDLLQILKFSYILQESSYKDSDINSVPRLIEDLWIDLRGELRSRKIFEECSASRRHRPETCGVCCKNRSDCAPPEGVTSVFGDRPLAKDCAILSDLQNVLNELINEGLLDSILPYLEPPSSNHTANESPTNDVEPRLSSAKMPTRKPKPRPSSGSCESHKSATTPNGRLFPDIPASKHNKEVTIHVCDEIQGLKKDFSCPQSLLLSQMGYFKDVTSGQSLEDVDISVHCDVSIFEWLMKWIKGTPETRPEFEPQSVISILISAEFLKMNPLVESALSYVHRNLNKILGITQNLSCLSDNLINKLCDLYKPSEVEMILDRKDRIQSRLYTKLITRLCGNLPQYEREILQTASSLHRCQLCGFYLTATSAKILPCQSLRSRIDTRGNVIPIHKKDPSFNINDFLKALRMELKSWRKVFWRLWGMVHSLYCSLCGVYFPVYLHEFCSFHPQDPEFDSIQFKNSTQPFGTYNCCKASIFRFQPLCTASRGCQSREHRVKLQADYDKKTYRILLAHREIICLVPYRKGGLKISSDINSITLPSNNIRIVGDGRNESIEGVQPFKAKRGLIDRRSLENPGSSGEGSRPTTSRPASKSLKRNQSSLHLFPSGSAPLLESSISVKASSSSYGRLKREPKLPPKKFYQSSSSSASSSSSSSSDEEEDEEGSEEGSLPDLDARASSSSMSNISAAAVVDVKLSGGTGDNVSVDNSSVERGGILANSILLRKKVSSSSSTAANGSSCDNNGDSSSWISDRSTRANQDQQREKEESFVRDIIRYLCRKQVSSKKSDTGRATVCPPEAILGLNRVWSSGGNIPQLSVYGGSFLRLETDWKDTHSAYVHHRTASSSGLSASQGRLRPLSAAAGLRVSSKIRVSKSLANLAIQN